MRKVLPVVAVVLFYLGCGQSSDRTQIAYVTNGVADFWTIAKVGAEAAGKEFDVDVDVRMPDNNTIQQQFLEDLVTRGVDGIAVSPIDPVNQTSLIDRVSESTRVITHDSDAPESKRLCYVGMDNYKAGRLCAELVKEVLPKGGEIMIFVGRLEQDNARGRRQGLIDGLLDRSYDPKRFDKPAGVITGEKYTILGTLTDQFDRDVAKANAEDSISAHKNLACMVGLFAYNPPLCLEALTRAEKVGQIKLVAFDEDFATLDAIKRGSIHGTVVQDPYRYGYESVRILAGLAKGDESVLPEGGFLDIPARQIRKSDVESFRADLQKKLDQATSK